MAVPLPKDQIENNAAPWPHSDQSPLKPNVESIQGLLNILPNGPKDGGLKVMTGSVKLFSEVWEAFDHDKVRPRLGLGAALFQSCCISACGRMVIARPHPARPGQDKMARRSRVQMGETMS